MAKHFSLDTNCLLRWLLQDIPEQAAAVDEILHSDRLCDIADVAIVEAAFVLEKVYELPRDLITEFLIALPSLGQVNCNTALLNKALPLYQNHPALSFTDCCLAAYAELNDAMPLLTFDQKLAKKLDHVELLTSRA